jgi:ubiquinone/menaquinone biosynthesis C-methylase UbiE
MVVGTAEATTLPNNNVDAITCAQALHWFDPDVFLKECLRIGQSGVIVIVIYSNTLGGSSVTYSKQPTDNVFEYKKHTTL